MRKLFITPFLLCSTLSATELEINDEALVVPSALANIKVTYNNGYFSVAKDDLSYTIPRYDLDVQLRSIIQNDQLERFLQQGYISVKERSDGSFWLESHVRLRGGGPRWDGFKGWLVGPHPGWHVFVENVLPKIAEGTKVVVKTAIDVARDIKKH